VIVRALSSMSTKNGSHRRMELLLSGGEAFEDILPSSDPGSFCRQKTVAETLDFFKKPIEDYASLMGLCGAAETARLLRRSGLHVRIYLPSVFFLSPRMWSVWSQFPGARTCRAHTFRRWLASAAKSAIIYHGSAIELYGITEVWSHCVCQFRDIGGSKIFDPYATGLPRDYPHGQYRLIDADRLDRLNAIKIMVTEKA
jgi:hypothetical protein